ncbi:MAG: iron ABC transporter permease [Alphaproteobacteria bacterium]|nr:iron ABC transporter permease [Alphaproteobacteria bacterium]MBU0797225.1 iron ABC transporter permease [Alphaproteobacteria bacterium]MBU0888987.1 iron ABC transporter permease [Alphaproteobacteria bacterium]MBU1814007.1 iron ABC transporter permease [Alphaproteobacteria bacterium]MBU2091500.1 iron ABC transporter permease [Alphaproteobacteria bacterium]
MLSRALHAASPSAAKAEPSVTESTLNTTSPVTIRAAAGTKRTRLGLWPVTSVVIATLVAIPVLVVFAHIFYSGSEIWAHLVATVLVGYIRNTLVLLLGVGIGVLVIGVGTAWLVTMCRFPGSRTFEWLLLLPLAFPAYVLAYVYTYFLQSSGPAQRVLRDATGWSYGDYWFPEIYSIEGAIAMFALVLYPYVYLLSRAAFLEQSVCALEVSRTLGCGPLKSFFRVAVPLARPAIVAGVTLALMETIADFATVQYFAVDTFTTGIYRTWFGMGDRFAAAQLAAVLLMVVLALLVGERLSRGGKKFHHTSRRYTHISPVRLRGGKAVAAFFACGLPILLGALIPCAVLVHMHLAIGDPYFGSRFYGYAWNSFLIAGLAAAIAVGISLLVAYAQRLNPSPLVRGAARVAGLGYAIPGSVVAVGVLIPLAAFDNALDGWMRSTFGLSTGLLLSGTIAALLYAYVVRFLAVSLNTVEAGLGKITPSMDQAARTLGKGPGATVWRVHIPVMRGSLLTAGLIVFVDVMKELPATLIIRPFNFDTLATRVYTLASDERLEQASTAALAIVFVGLVPVILLSWMIARSRPGHR